MKFHEISAAEISVTDFTPAIAGWRGGAERAEARAERSVELAQARVPPAFERGGGGG